MTEQQIFYYIFLGECSQLQQFSRRVSAPNLTSTSLWVDPPPAWWTYAPRWEVLYLFRRLVVVSRSMGIAPLPCSTSRWNWWRCACTSLKLPLCACVCMCVHVWACVTLLQLVNNTVKVYTCHMLRKHENQGTMKWKKSQILSSLSESGVWAWDDTKLKAHHNGTCQYTLYAPGQA